MLPYMYSLKTCFLCQLLTKKNVLSVIRKKQPPIYSLLIFRLV